MGGEIHIPVAVRQLCGSRGIDVAIAALATRQHGVVSRVQLLALGITEGEIRHRIGTGRLIRLCAGVYAVGHAKLSREGRWMAAVLAGGPDAVLMGPSAAALHGFAADDAEVIHVRARRRSRPGLRFHHTSLSKGEVTTRQGMRVTTAARTLLDLATMTSAPRLERSLREALFTRATSIQALDRLLSAHQGQRGAGALARALQQAKDAPGHFRSNKEQRFKNWLQRNRLPLPAFNQELRIDGVGIEVDCHWPQHGLVAEIDDRSTHARRRSFETDRIRDRALQARGLRVIRIAEPYDEPLRIDLRRLLRRR